MNWNELFQSNCYELNKLNKINDIKNQNNIKKQKLELCKQLQTINRDFVSIAKTYAKTIISELFLDNNEKSLKLRQDLGGIAGGVKLIWRGILFKLADATKGPYQGNEEYASKAMGHELTSACHIFRCNIDGLHVSLQALIDYKGFRMHAQSLLPINNETLIMGTSDAGININDGNNDINIINKMKLLSSELNIREHIIKDKVLYTGCDVEIHKGTDNKYYMVDLARLFPPESPLIAKHLNSPILKKGIIVYIKFKLKVDNTKYKYIKGKIIENINNNDEDELYKVIIKKDDIYDINLNQNEIKNENNNFYEIIKSRNDIKENKMSIFWRLLRPEFVKNRGKELIQKHYHKIEGIYYNKLSNLDNNNNNINNNNINKSLNYNDINIEDDLNNYSNLDITTLNSGYAAANEMVEGNYDSDSSDFDNDDSYLYNIPISLKREISQFEKSDYNPVKYLSINEENNINNENDYNNYYNMYYNFNLSDNTSNDNNNNILNQEFILNNSFENNNINLNPTLSNYSSIYTETTPLSSDAFSSFSLSDPNYIERNKEVNEATNILINKLIPAFAFELIELYRNELKELLKYGNNDPIQLLFSSSSIFSILSSTSQSLTSFMHRHGINIRHIGFLRSLIPLSYSIIRLRLLIEIVSRSLKNSLREIQRNWMKREKSTSENGMLLLVAKFLNLVTGASNIDDVEYFWESKITSRIEDHFGLISLTDLERSSLMNICTSSSLILPLINRLCDMCGIELTNEAKIQLDNFHKNEKKKKFEFLSGDINELKPKIKHMHQVDYIDGMMLCLLGQKREQKQIDPHIVNRLHTLACQRLHQALDRVPNDLNTRFLLADAYQARAFSLSHIDEKESQKYFESYRSLKEDMKNTHCSITGVNYHNNILGVILTCEYYHKYTSLKTIEPLINENQLLENELLQKYLPLPINYINVEDDIVSYEYYLQLYEKEKELLNDKKYNKKKYKVIRFLPLIIDESNANKNLELLKLEITKILYINNKKYSLSITNDLLPPFSPYQCLYGLASLMNSMTVSLIKFINNDNNNNNNNNKNENNNDDDIDKALLGYVRFHHMLLYFCKKYPILITIASRRVENFINDEEFRSKDYTANLGEFLIYLLLSPRGWDNILRRIFLEEVLTRNTRWVLKKYSNLILLEDDNISPYRLISTFNVNFVSYRLVMFQVWFLNNIGRRGERKIEEKNIRNNIKNNNNINNQDKIFHKSINMMLKLYNSSFGTPTAGMREGLKNAYNEIMNIDFYGDFLERIGIYYSPNQFTILLRNVSRLSDKKKYNENNMNIQDIDKELEMIPPSPYITYNSNHEKIIDINQMKNDWNQIKIDWNKKKQIYLAERELFQKERNYQIPNNNNNNNKKKKNNNNNRKNKNKKEYNNINNNNISKYSQNKRYIKNKSFNKNKYNKKQIENINFPLPSSPPLSTSNLKRRLSDEGKKLFLNVYDNKK